MGTSDEWFLLNHDLGTPKSRGLHSGENTAFTRGITLSELEGNSAGPVIDDRAGGKRGLACQPLVLAERKRLYAEPLLQREVKRTAALLLGSASLSVQAFAERTFEHCVAVVRRRPQQRLVHLSQVAAGSIVQPMEKKQRAHVWTDPGCF